METRAKRVALIVVILLVISGLPVAIDWSLSDSYPDRTSVTFVQANGEEVDTIDVEVSSTPDEMYTGLGDYDSLGRNEGMLFVHAEVDQYTYTMRGMSFPIDIIFIDEQQDITTIHHATLENSTATYTGRAKYVIEVNVHWTTDHNITVGDRIQIHWE